MPEGQSWFTIFPGYEAIRAAFASILGNETWIGHSTLQVGHVLTSLFVVLLLTIFALKTRARAVSSDAVVPDDKLTAPNFVELVVGYIYRSMSEVMGPKAAKYFLPLIGTCAFFILFSNLLGLVPGFAPPTANFNVTVACAAIVVVTTHVYGFREHGMHYLAHFFGPIRKWYVLPLMLLIFVIEIIGHFARLGSLSIRLAANMFADHLVIETFMERLFAWFVPLPVMMLGTLVCIVQTLVFCLLATIYIGLAVAHEEGHGEEAHH